MSILKELIEFDETHRRLFFRKLQQKNNEKKFDLFLTIIKYSSDKEKAQLYSTISDRFVSYLEKEANKRENIKKENYEKAEKKIKLLIDTMEKKLKKALNHTKILKPEIKKQRDFMKAKRWNDFNIITDELLDMPKPEEVKEYDTNSKIITLPEPDDKILKNKDIYQCITKRKSRRKFKNDSLKIDELSYLLYTTQGVRDKKDKYHKKTVPSGGARQPFETYLAINNVEGLKKGLYRYLIFDHKLLFIEALPGLKESVENAVLGQKFVSEASAIFFWAAIPYRMEWKYFLKSHKVILLEAGHICQNLYLAAESINCGTCAIGAYDQKKVDDLFKLDGVEEFIVYIAPVGKV